MGVQRALILSVGSNIRARYGLNRLVSSIHDHGKGISDANRFCTVIDFVEFSVRYTNTPLGYAGFQPNRNYGSWNTNRLPQLLFDQFPQQLGTQDLVYLRDSGAERRHEFLNGLFRRQIRHCHSLPQVS